jgi:hypothetical protein
MWIEFLPNVAEKRSVFRPRIRFEYDGEIRPTYSDLFCPGNMLLVLTAIRNPVPKLSLTVCFISFDTDFLISCLYDSCPLEIKIVL